MRASSNTSTEVPGFRLERELGRGPRGVVYEATQLGLERRVALKLLPPTPFRAADWPTHPHVADLYAAGEWTGGMYIARQLARGTSLATAELDPATARTVLDQVAEALTAAHAAGVVHGAVTASNVFAEPGDGALLTDFGLSPGSALGDLAALAALRERYEDPASRRPARPWRGAWALTVPTVLAAAAAVVVFTRAPAVPAPAPGAQALGSALAGGDVRSVDCDGKPPGGTSPACTLMPAALPGRLVAAPRDGAVIGWAVRGARGTLALQIVRPAHGRFTTVASTAYVRVTDAGAHALPAALAIRTGDRIAVELTPGAAIGTRSVAGTATELFVGPLRFGPRRAERGFAREVLLRVDYVPGAAPRGPAPVTGARAAALPPGRTIASRDVGLRAGGARTITVVVVPGGVALDVFRGARRMARVRLAGADPHGHLLTVAISGQDAGEPTPDVRWRNPDGGVIEHTYHVTTAALEVLR